MKKRLPCLLVAMLLLLSGLLPLTAHAEPLGTIGAVAPGTDETPPPDGTGSDGPSDPDSTPEPETPPASETPPATEAPGEPEQPEEPEPPTLEELRDKLMTILGTGEETQAIRAGVDRIIALGDPGGALRQWLESTIRKYQIEQELAQLTGALGTLETTNTDIGAIAQAAAELKAEPDELLVEMEAACPAAAALVKTLEGFDTAGEQGAQFEAILSGAGKTKAGQALASVRLLMALKDSGLLDEAGTATAQRELNAQAGRLAALCQTVTGQEREALENASRAIAARANLTAPLSPTRLAVVGRALSCTAPIFTYNSAIMLSVGDAAAFLGGEVVEQGDMLAIVAPGTVLEMLRGSSDAYRNDKLCKLPAPVLNFDGVCFMPLDTVLACCGMERVTVEGYEIISYPLA